MGLYQLRVGKTVDAYKLAGYNFDIVQEWSESACILDDDFPQGKALSIDTPLGEMLAFVGDVVAKDSDGEFFVLDGESFQAQFKMVA